MAAPALMTEELQQQVVKALNDHKDISARFETEIKKTGEVSGEAKEIAVKVSNELKDALAAAKKATDDGAAKFTEMQTKMDALQAQIARSAVGNAHADKKTLAELVTGTEEFKKFNPADRYTRHYRTEIEKKAIVTDPAAPYTTVPRDRLPGLIMVPNQQLLIRDILPSGQTASNLIEYVKENVVTLNAGPQYSPGTSPAGIDNALKNESTITYTLVTSAVTTLAHFIKVSKQMLADTPFLNSEINGRLLYGLELKEESEILNGTGISGDLYGLIPQATAYAATYAKAGDTKIDKARHAMLQVALQKFVPSAHVMGVVDWHDIETTKDAYSRYLIGDPRGVLGQILWGLPVVASLSMSTNTYLCGDFRQAAQLFDRMSYTVAIGYVNDDFTRNMVTVLAEERLALAFYQAKALIYNGAFV